MNNLSEELKLQAKSFTHSVNVGAELSGGADQDVARGCSCLLVIGGLLASRAVIAQLIFYHCEVKSQGFREPHLGP